MLAQSFKSLLSMIIFAIPLIGYIGSDLDNDVDKTKEKVILVKDDALSWFELITSFGRPFRMMYHVVTAYAKHSFFGYPIGLPMVIIAAVIVGVIYINLVVLLLKWCRR